MANAQAGKEPVSPSRPPAPLAQSLRTGLSWTSTTAVAARLATFVAQIALGILLSPSDFGVYAIAISVSTLLTTLQDGGVREIIAQQGKERYRALAGPSFWMALAINVVIGCILALIAGPTSRIFEQSSVAPMMWIMAAYVLLSTPNVVLMASLRAEFRFKAFACLNSFDIIARSVGTVMLAFLGVGPLSFVLPLPFVAVAQWLILMVLTSQRPWLERPRFEAWANLFSSVRWLLAGSLALAVLAMGDYLVLGRTVPAATLGVYYFAFQLIAQAMTLLSAGLITVLMPTLASILDDPDRRRTLTLRSLQSLLMVAAGASLGLAVIFRPLETLIWQGKWDEAGWALIAFSVAFPIRITFAVARASMIAAGEYRRLAFLTAAKAAGLITVVLLTSLATSSPTLIATAVSVYFLASSAPVLRFAFRDMRVTIMDIGRVMVPSWALAVGAATLCVTGDALLLIGVHPSLRVGFLGLAFTLLYAALCRFLTPDRVRQVLALMGPRSRRLTSRVLAL